MICLCCLQEADLGQLEERIRAKLSGETPKCALLLVLPAI